VDGGRRAMTSAILTIAACAALNPARGDDRWKDAIGLPGRARSSNGNK